MLLRYARLLESMKQNFIWFIFWIVIYEMLQIAESYTLSAVIQLFQARIDIAIWAMAFIALVIYDELFMRLDNHIDWTVIAKILYPIYHFVKLKAVGKFLELSLPWHDSHNSGELVEKVNKGAGKVDDLANSLAWEFFPTSIQTVLSLVPLLYFSPPTALLALVSFSLFFYLSIRSAKVLQPYRKQRHDLYEVEGHISTEIVQGMDTIVAFGQEEYQLAKYDALLQRITTLGEQEARIGIYRYSRWKIRLLTLTRRAVLMLWVWQLYTGSMDIAGLIFVNVLMEKLFHSFWQFGRLYERATEASEGATRLINLIELRHEGKLA